MRRESSRRDAATLSLGREWPATVLVDATIKQSRSRTASTAGRPRSDHARSAARGLTCDEDNASHARVFTQCVSQTSAQSAG